MSNTVEEARLAMREARHAGDESDKREARAALDLAIRSAREKRGDTEPVDSSIMEARVAARAARAVRHAERVASKSAPRQEGELEASGNVRPSERQGQ